MGLNPRKGTGMAKSLLTPAQAAAIVTDMILTADARIKLKTTAERRALEEHLAKTALSPEKRRAILAAFDIPN